MGAEEGEGGEGEVTGFGEGEEDERGNAHQKWHHWLQWQISVLLEEGYR